MIRKVWAFYLEGFREMRVGRVLWVVILVKVAVMFLVLRLCFFRPVLGGLDAAERAEYVGDELIGR